MNQLTVFNISAQFGGAHEVIHPVVLQDASHLVLIDCGYVGFLPQIEQALTEGGFSARDLTHVYITHQDHDHMGALADLKSKYPGVQVVAGREEAPYISGAKKSLRLAQAEAMQEQLPPEQQEFGRAFCALLKRVQPVPVDVEVKDGDVLDWCGGCIVLATPGHTPGHTLAVSAGIPDADHRGCHRAGKWCAGTPEPAVYTGYAPGTGIDAKASGIWSKGTHLLPRRPVDSCLSAKACRGPAHSARGASV